MQKRQSMLNFQEEVVKLCKKYNCKIPNNPSDYHCCEIVLQLMDFYNMDDIPQMIHNRMILGEQNYYTRIYAKSYFYGQK